MAAKRELDKESMFRKIMPSAGETRVSNGNETTPEDVSALQGGPELSAQDAAPVPVQPEYAVQPPPAPAQEQPQETETQEVPAESALSYAEQAAPAPSQEAQAAVAYDAPAPPQAAPVATAYDVPAPPQAAPAVTYDAPAAAEYPPQEFREHVSENTEHDGEKPRPINLAEIVAEEYYPRYQQRLNGCPCPRCKDDVLGITLNKVKPRYIASDRLNPLDLKNRALITETVTCLIQAIQVVKKSPHHNEYDLIRQ